MQVERTLFVASDHLRFTAAHMTVAPDGSKERMHGHSYRVAVRVRLADYAFDRFLNLRVLRQAVEAICAAWNEHFILATECPHLRWVERTAQQVTFELCGKRYSMPADELLELPYDNAVIENLSHAFGLQLWERLAPHTPEGLVTALEITLEEAPGLGGTVTLTP